MKMLFVLFVLYTVCISHIVNMPPTHHDLDTSIITRKSLFETLDNDTELLDECEYLDLTNSQTLDIKDCDLNLLHLNVRGLISKQSKLVKLLQSCIGKHTIHVATINETWLTKDNEHCLNIPDYHAVKRNRLGKRGGGVCILIHKSLKYKEIDTINTLNFKHIEHICVEIKLQGKNMSVSSLYRPPNTSALEFNTEYEKYINKLKLTKLDTVIGLDHNLDLLKMEKHKPTQEFFNMNINNQLFPTITKPTRITSTTATLLDNLMVNLPLNQNYFSGILVEDMSDHLPCLLVLKGRRFEQREPITFTYREMKEDNIQKIKEELREISWECIMHTDDVNESFDVFHHQLQECISRNTTEKRITIPYKQILKEPWMTLGIKKATRKKLHLYKQTLKINSTKQDRQKYIEYRNTLQKTIRKAKINYYNKQCLESKTNVKRLWSLINEIIGKRGSKSTTIEAIKVDNTLRYNPKTITNELGKYFSSVGRVYANQIPPGKTPIDDYISKIPQNPKSMYFVPITKPEIEKLIRKLEPKKSSGHDGISNKLIQDLCDVISYPLTLIFNQSLQTGIFPSSMKWADITPLYKSKCKYEKTNYRPISLLLTLSKLLEKAVYSRTYNFLEQNQTLYNSQYGFRSQHSCQDAISELVGKIIKNMEEQKYTMAVFIDLSKAFDTLEHKVLFAKLYRYGIRGLTLDWFISYLSNRKLRVKCMSEMTGRIEYSDYYDVDYGTPQGSCLGPLLFLIFSNDLHRTLECSSSILFADDTNIYDQNKNLDFLKWNLEQELTKVVDWFNANKLTLNVDKTQCLLFRPNQIKQQGKTGKAITMKLDNNELIPDTYVKFLGIWLDHQLNWNHQFQTIIHKIQKNRVLLQVSQKYLPPSTKVMVYYAHIYSHLSYCIRIWGNMISKAQIKQLQTEQNKCAKLIKPYSLTNEIFKEYGLAKIEQIIQIENCKLGYNIDKKLVPTALYKVITEDSKGKTLIKTHTYGTRNKAMPNIPRVGTNKYKTSFLNKGIKEFCGLPQELKNIENWPKFKSKLKYHLIQ